MKHYSKRTIALCLASAITVVGAFGAENYKNNLMSLKINNGSGGYISMTAYTEKPYNLPIKTIRQDANTYILIFPETGCEARLPKMTDYENIESIGIATYPYTNEREGYTKITVKTLGSPVLKASTMLFIQDGKAEQQDNLLISTTQAQSQQSSYWDVHKNSASESTVQNSVNKAKSVEGVSAANQVKQEKIENKNDTNPITAESAKEEQKQYVPQNYTNTGTASEHTTAIICVLVLIMLIGFIMMIGKDKMASVVGDNNDFDIDSDKQKKDKKSSKSKKIRKTINSLDKTYKSSRQRERRLEREREIDVQEQPIQEEVQPETASQMVVVDLDTLYQEKTQQKEAETDDLAELLNEFTFDEPQIPEEEPFNEELYQEVINNSKIKFSKSDIERLNQLMQLEITQETLANVDKYQKAAASKPKKLTQSQILENLLTTYSISQNIEFSNDDVDAITKLMNVELDESFVTDLTTNPMRVKEVEAELNKKKSKPHKSSEVLTLNVKDLLPDLSQELAKQGNKPIESEVKRDAVYYSEGYEVSKLSVAKELKNISSLNQKGANDYRPSDFLPIVENGYEFSTLSIKDELPDLADVKAHPDKYSEKKVEKTVDENALLKSISNVTFKPFYTDVQEELNQFENFEIMNPEYEQDNQSEIQSSNRVEDEAEKLLKLIETQQAQRALKRQALEEAKEFKKELQKASTKKKEKIKDAPQVVFEIDGKKYILIKTVPCGKDAECNLAQSDEGYSVFGYNNGKRIELKHYDSLNTTNMQVRTNEKDENGDVQYLIKIGMNKFIIKMSEKGMEFVMDLC